MKKKSALIFGLLLVVLLSFGSGIVLGKDEKEIPRLTTACENKAGLIHGFDDDFSVLKKCPKGSRKVTLGVDNSSSNTNTGSLNAGKVAFVSFEGTSPIYYYVLDKDGKAWVTDSIVEENILNRDSRIDLPSGINVGDVADWSNEVFVTKAGDVYVYKNDAWTLTGFGSGN
jgi:hypothetical protein